MASAQSTTLTNVVITALVATGITAAGLTLRASPDYSSTYVTSPSLTLDSASFLKYTEATLSASGSYHMRACALNPYTGTGVVKAVNFECGDTRNASTVDIGYTVALGASGTTFVDSTATATGSLFSKTSTGSTQIDMLWDNDQYICAHTATGVGLQDLSCKLKVWSSEHFET